MNCKESAVTSGKGAPSQRHGVLAPAMTMMELCSNELSQRPLFVQTVKKWYWYWLKLLIQVVKIYEVRSTKYIYVENLNSVLVIRQMLGLGPAITSKQSAAELRSGGLLALGAGWGSPRLRRCLLYFQKSFILAWLLKYARVNKLINRQTDRPTVRRIRQLGDRRIGQPGDDAQAKKPNQKCKICWCWCCTYYKPTGYCTTDYLNIAHKTRPTLLMH